MKIVNTEYLSSSFIREELKHTIQVSPEEFNEFKKALSIVQSYEKLVLTSEVVSSDWHNVQFKVDNTVGVVYAVLCYGMEG